MSKLKSHKNYFIIIEKRFSAKSLFWSQNMSESCFAEIHCKILKCEKTWDDGGYIKLQCSASRDKGKYIYK